MSQWSTSRIISTEPPPNFTSGRDIPLVAHDSRYDSITCSVKKLTTTPKWKEQSHRNTLRELTNRRRRLKWLAHRRQHLQGVPRPASNQRGRSRVTISAPDVLSVISNPHETITFLTQLEQNFRKRRDVRLDLSNVSELTSDAVVVLLSRLIDDRFHHGMKFSGTEPKAETPRRLLDQSGFFTFVHSRKLKPPPEDGQIRRETERLVESEVADELVAFSTKRMIGRVEHRRAAQMSLVECMANTHEHSAKTPGGNYWWATVYCPRNSNKSFFTIIDTGIGIFNSVTVRRYRRKLGFSDNATLFRDWIEGRIELPSRTGKRNRGKGLLAIHGRFKKGRDGMNNLIVVANDVYARFADNSYEKLNQPFRGTFVYWEIWEK